jgi:hypothetical protein
MPIHRHRLTKPTPQPETALHPEGQTTNVYRLTRMAALPHFNEHGPLDTSSRVLSPFPLTVAITQLSSPGVRSDGETTHGVRSDQIAGGTSSSCDV